jgi:hypothetical protein
MLIAEDSLKPQLRRFPASLAWIVGCLCCIPFLVNLLGLDFGNHNLLDRATLESTSSVRSSRDLPMPSE